MKIINFTKIKEIIKSFKKDPFFIHAWDNEKIYGYSRKKQSNELHKNIYGGYWHNPYYSYSNTHMFIEDVHTGVMPYLHFIKKDYTGPNFSFNDDIDTGLQKIICCGISGRDTFPNISDVVTSFIRKTTLQLMSDGVVHYEIVYEKEKNKIKSCSLELVPPKYLFKGFKNYYQIIPWWVAKKTGNKVGIIKIPKDKILQINFPKKLGGKSGLYKKLARIYKISKEVLPPFTLDSMKENEQTGFDTAEYSKLKYLEIAKLTRQFGWNQRMRLNDYTTEYYFFKEYLDSVLAKIIFRETILKKLNEFLNRPIINLGTSIKMNGYATREEIESWNKRMEAGNIKFIDIFNDLKER